MALQIQVPFRYKEILDKIGETIKKILLFKGAPDPVARELYFQTEYCMNITQISHSDIRKSGDEK